MIKKFFKKRKKEDSAPSDSNVINMFEKNKEKREEPKDLIPAEPVDDKWKMFRGIGRERVILRIKKVVIIFLALFVVIWIFQFFSYYGKQKKLISSFQNTNIKERLVTNNRPVRMDKPYKIKDGIVYIPVVELCKNFKTKATYKFTPDGGIELKYRNSTYLLKRGSNEVRFKGDPKNMLKMDGVVTFMDNTVYVPLDFIYKVLDVNVVQGADGTVYMDNYPKKFDYSWVKENRYIAHALGGIEGNAYTNSREALEKSYDRGFRVVETDVNFSSDDKLILMHAFDVESLANLGLPMSWAKNKPTESEFLGEKILNRYHTMSFEELLKYMNKHKDLYVVIDLKDNRIKDVEKAYREIVREAKAINPDILNRIIPQIYYEAMYKPLMNIYDFKSMIFTTYRIEDFQIKKIVDFSYEHGIKIVAVNKFNFSKDLTKQLLDRGISLYMFTYNDIDKVNSLRNKYVSGFYTDFLPKEKIIRDSEGKVVEDKNSNNNGYNGKDSNAENLEGIN